MPRPRRHRRKKETPELELTTFLNLMVVLISFLLVTAVFSRITIQEMKLPTAAGGGAQADTPLVTIEVILRHNGIELGDGKIVVAAIPNNAEGKYDIDKLTQYLLELKGQYKDKTDATLLVEPDIAYEDVIHIMDVMKVARVRQTGKEEVEKIELFPDVSMGDAP